MVLPSWTCVCGQRNAGPAPCSRCLTPAPPAIEAARDDLILPEQTTSRWLATSRGLIVPLALVIAVLLIGGALAVGAAGSDRGDRGGRGDQGGDGGRATGSAGSETITATPDGADTSGLSGVARDIAAAIPSLMRFVQDARGLAYKAPVQVALLPDDAFKERLRNLEEEQTEEDRELIETNERVLRALGLLEGDVDLDEAIDSLLGSAVAGFYDFEADDLVVRGERLSPGVRVTFVHELTHALQDQHFDLDREELEERDDEASQAFDALVEGDAVRVEQLYLDTLPADEQKAAQAEELEAAEGIDPSIPRILLESIAFPYALGPGFAAEVVRVGGQTRLDEAYRAPPTTSEQIIHPDLYLADGEVPREVADPAADGEKIDEGVVGEFGFILVLQGILDQRSAVIASNGWGGDRYVAWDEGDRTCVRTNLVMDTAADAAEMADALREVEDRKDGVEVRVSPQLLTFTSCG